MDPENEDEIFDQIISEEYDNESDGIVQIFGITIPLDSSPSDLSERIRKLEISLAHYQSKVLNARIIAVFALCIALLAWWGSK